MAAPASTAIPFVDADALAAAPKNVVLRTDALYRSFATRVAQAPGTTVHYDTTTTAASGADLAAVATKLADALDVHIAFTVAQAAAASIAIVTAERALQQEAASALAAAEDDDARASLLAAHAKAIDGLRARRASLLSLGKAALADADVARVAQVYAAQHGDGMSEGECTAASIVLAQLRAAAARAAASAAASAVEDAAC